MTAAAQVKIAVYGGLALIAWLLTTKAKAPPAASVELGVGTVNGIYGNDVYYSERGVITGPGGAPLQSAQPINPAVDPRMRELIDRSNAAIAEDDL